MLKTLRTKREEKNKNPPFGNNYQMVIICQGRVFAVFKGRDLRGEYFKSKSVGEGMPAVFSSTVKKYCLEIALFIVQQYKKRAQNMRTL